MARKITVELTGPQAQALRLAADYILYAGEGPEEHGWSAQTAAALRRADDKIADAAGWKRGELG